VQCRPQTARVVATNFEVANSKLSRSSPAEKNLVGSPTRSETTSDFQPSMNNSRNQILPPFRSEKHLGPRREARACPMWSGRSQRRLGASKGVPHRYPDAAARSEYERTSWSLGLGDGLAMSVLPMVLYGPCSIFAFICFQLLADWPQGDKRQVYSAIARAWFLQFRGAKTACESVVNSR